MCITVIVPYHALLQAEEQWIKVFPEQRPSSVTVQLSLEVKEEHVPQMELTCLSTIPGFMGHHVRHTDYADHRTQVFLGTLLFFLYFDLCYR